MFDCGKLELSGKGEEEYIYLRLCVVVLRDIASVLLRWTGRLHLPTMCTLKPSPTMHCYLEAGLMGDD